jgi:hypothetical protein
MMELRSLGGLVAVYAILPYSFGADEENGRR